MPSPGNSAEHSTSKLPVPCFGAVYSPVLLIVPPLLLIVPLLLLTCQVNVGCVAIAWPNWSTASGRELLRRPVRHGHVQPGVTLRLVAV